MRRLYLAVPGQAAGQAAWLTIAVADTFFTRLRGLLGTAALPAQQGLLLRGCDSVHMFGMRYALDIVYLDKDGVILKLVPDLRPWQLSYCRKAKDALELNSGTIRQAGWQVGDRLLFLEQ